MRVYAKHRVWLPHLNQVREIGVNSEREALELRLGGIGWVKVVRKSGGESWRDNIPKTAKHPERKNEAAGAETTFQFLGGYLCRSWWSI